MKQLYILALGIFLSVNGVIAQTNVSGFISTNTNWTIAGSPYIVTGNVLLSQGYTLTIDPGVVVKFGTNNALQIDGELIAIGTPTQHITFTSNQANPQPGDWAKLHFSDFSSNAVYNAQGNYLSGSIMKYCDVLYGGSLLWGSIDIQQSSPYLNHCRIMNGSWCGINFNGDSLRIDSSRISDLPKRGIYYQGGHFLFQGDTFVLNLEGAIHLLQQYDGKQSRIDHCFFRQNYGALSWQNNGVQYLTISNSIFTYNNGPEVIALQGVGDTITCNKFRYNTNGPVIHFNDNANPWAGGVIHNNLIEYNTNSSGPSVFHVGSGQGYDTLYISNNTVSHNSSPGNSCCQFDVYFNGLTQGLQIYNNSFTENDGTSFMMLWGPQTNDPSFNFMYLRNNNYINPLCQYELNNQIPYGSPNLQIGNHYWGSSSTSFVDGRIYDYFDFANQSVAYYNPILAGAVMVDTTCQPFQVPVGVREEDVSGIGINVFPNPTDGEVTISGVGTELLFAGSIEIVNPLGQVISRSEIDRSSVVVLELPQEPGIYFIRWITQEGVFVAECVRN